MSEEEIEAKRTIPIDAERVKREAKEFGGSTHITLPKSWEGSKVIAIKLEEDDDSKAFAIDEEGE